MKELYIFLLKLAAAFGFMLFVWLMSEPFTSSECKHNKRYSKKTIHGTVIEKEKDSFYSSSERVILMPYRKEFTWDERSYEARSNSIYDKIAIGDSLSKEEGSLLLMIHKKDTIIEVDLSFDCDESWKEKRR